MFVVFVTVVAMFAVGVVKVLIAVGLVVVVLVGVGTRGGLLARCEFR